MSWSLLLIRKLKEKVRVYIFSVSSNFSDMSPMEPMWEMQFFSLTWKGTIQERQALFVFIQCMADTNNSIITVISSCYSSSSRITSSPSPSQISPPPSPIFLSSWRVGTTSLWMSQWAARRRTRQAGRGRQTFKCLEVRRRKNYFLKHIEGRK